MTEALRTRIDGGVRHAALAIIAGKGATWFGAGAALARIVRVIALDQHEVLTVSSMSREETKALGTSARLLKGTTDALWRMRGD